MFYVCYDEKVDSSNFFYVIEKVVQSSIRKYLHLKNDIFFEVVSTMNKSVLGRRMINPDFGNERIIINGIDHDNIGDILLTVVHELYHSHQVNIGKLGYELVDGEWKHTWLGDVYTGPNDYHSLPWEIDAYKNDFDIANNVAIDFNKCLGM